MKTKAMETKPHGMTGKRNAAKDDSSATSFIHARCKPQDKAIWVRAAQAEGLKLTEWIVQRLNASNQ
jgi:uncharacterized protein (DUF1778 family)